MSRSQLGRFTRGLHAERPLSMCTSPTCAPTFFDPGLAVLDLTPGRALPIATKSRHTRVYVEAAEWLGGRYRRLVQRALVEPAMVGGAWALCSCSSLFSAMGGIASTEAWESDYDAGQEDALFGADNGGGDFGDGNDFGGGF